MNFTREPIIETIISAKEGYKLSLKSSKNSDVEEYLVDAVEVVSFGGTFFYRSQEKPRAFFIPSADYEILEVREARLALKTATIEKNIKISGGKESSKHTKHQPQEVVEDTSLLEGKAEDESGVVNLPPKGEGKQEQKRDKKRYRRGSKRNQEQHAPSGEAQAQAQAAPSVPSVPGIAADEKAAPVQINSVFSHLLKPPEGLISDSIHKYRKMDEMPVSPDVNQDISRVMHSSHFSDSPAKQEPVLVDSEKMKDPELISEAPRRGDRFVEEVTEDVESLIFSPIDYHHSHDQSDHSQE